MAFAFPLFLGAAMLLLAGRKKKRRRTGAARAPLPKGEWKAYQPSAKDKSVPISTKPPATPTKPSDLRPFSGVRQVQQALIMVGHSVGSKGADGSWGRNTSGAISAFQGAEGLDVTGVPDKETLGVLFARAYGQPGEDECDPLNPSSWGAGRVCAIHEGRYIALPQDMSALPSVSENFLSANVIFSPDLSRVEIGVQWRYVVLEAWLKKQKREGKVGLSGAKKTLEWIHENLVRAPSKFLGAGNETVGGIIYLTLIIIATRGKAVNTTMTNLIGSARAAKVISTAMVWFGIADSVAGGLGLFNAFLATPKELLQAQMMQLINAFAEEHKVLVGTQWVSLSDLPLDAPGVDVLLRNMMSWIGKFQVYQYD